MGIRRIRGSFGNALIVVVICALLPVPFCLQHWALASNSQRASASYAHRLLVVLVRQLPEPARSKSSDVSAAWLVVGAQLRGEAEPELYGHAEARAALELRLDESLTRRDWQSWNQVHWVVNGMWRMEPPLSRKQLAEFYAGVGEAIGAAEQNSCGENGACSLIEGPGCPDGK